jgi:hypothetical protein
MSVHVCLYNQTILPLLLRSLTKICNSPTVACSLLLLLLLLLLHCYQPRLPSLLQLQLQPLQDQAVAP